jgi:hypothetical protein
MNLNEIIQDDRSRLLMKEENFFNERVAFEGKPSKTASIVRPNGSPTLLSRLKLLLTGEADYW